MLYSDDRYVLKRGGDGARNFNCYTALVAEFRSQSGCSLVGARGKKSNTTAMRGEFRL
jgi:hypothetical protein